MSIDKKKIENLIDSLAPPGFEKTRWEPIDLTADQIKMLQLAAECYLTGALHKAHIVF